MFPVTCAEPDRRHVIMHQTVYLATLSVAQIMCSCRIMNDLASHFHGEGKGLRKNYDHPVRTAKLQAENVPRSSTLSTVTLSQFNTVTLITLWAS